MKVERVAPVVAILLIVVGILSTLHVQSLQEKADGNYIKINGNEFIVSELQKSCSEKEIETSAGEAYTGISLSEMINLSGIKNPGEYKYEIIGADGYSKIVEWNHIKKGIFSIGEKETIFSDLPKQFWVKDVAEIKVI